MWDFGHGGNLRLWAPRNEEGRAEAAQGIRKTKAFSARYPVGLRAGFGAAGQRRGTAEPFRHELIAPIGTRDRTGKFAFSDTGGGIPLSVADRSALVAFPRTLTEMPDDLVE